MKEIQTATKVHRANKNSIPSILTPTTKDDPVGRSYEAAQLPPELWKFEKEYGPSVTMDQYSNPGLFFQEWSGAEAKRLADEKKVRKFEQEERRKRKKDNKKNRRLRKTQLQGVRGSSADFWGTSNQITRTGNGPSNPEPAKQWSSSKV